MTLETVETDVPAAFASPTLQGHYDALEQKASACIGCGKCEKQCPFQVPIIERMKKAAELFEA